jgi:hypothetical protein
MWWASDGPAAPQTPQGISLIARRCLRSLALSRLFIVFLDPLLFFANLIAPAMGLLRVIRHKTKLTLDLLHQLLTHDFAWLAHRNALAALLAMKVKNSRVIFTILTIHAAFIAPRRTAALNSWG